MNFQSIIATRRDGKRHSEAELRALALAACDGSVPDYQLAAWLMAAYLNPLNEDETAWLTQGMADSGEKLDLSGLPKPWVDKHSTGGVGDKTTLVLLPLLAACGLTVVKMSGRGLGITGGTIDKLSAVPGFRVDLTPDEMKAQAARIGLALTGQTPKLAPADKVLYALRDTTGTVSSIPLIVSSILSKKLAGGAETVVLDVKVGSGAFMRTSQEARVLARSLIETARRCGLKVRVVLSDMNQPLGSAMGNALEVREAIAILKGDGLNPSSERFRELCLQLAAITLEASGLVATREEGLARATAAFQNGLAQTKARDWFTAQGAAPSFFDDLAGLPEAASQITVTHSGSDAFVTGLDAESIGRTVVTLGGGRERKDDTLDLGVGIELIAPIGARVSDGDALFRVHARSDSEAKHAVRRVRSAVKLAPFGVPAVPALIATL